MSFYPRHPRGWRHDNAGGQADPEQFLSTPPSRVATVTVIRIIKFITGFYPRHPRGWRPATSADGPGRISVSIHATLAGGDCPGTRFVTARTLFLSTPPSRVATTSRQTRHRFSRGFYPRHPRGWRRRSGYSERQHRQVSIHATLAGGDAFMAIRLRLGQLFLSTPPSRVATTAEPDAFTKPFVSIHATLAGGDLPLQQAVGQGRPVSIHATLAGGDC